MYVALLFLFTLINIRNCVESLWCDGVIDISHHTTVQNLTEVRDSGVILIIHKATQGLKFVDKKYAERQQTVEALGIEWGAYHFGTGDNGTLQADHFMDTIGTNVKGPMVLDIEENPHGSVMGVNEATHFVNRFQKRSGCFPIIYSRKNFLEDFKFDTPFLTQTNLWIARYASENLLKTPRGWNDDNIIFWQHTDGKKGPLPHSVPGIKGGVDRDKYQANNCNKKISFVNNDCFKK